MLDGWLLMILRALFFSLMETKVRYLGHIIRNELCNNDDDDVQCTSTLKHLFLELAVFVLKANASGGMWWHFEDLAQASKMNKWSLSIYSYIVPNCNAMLSYCLYKHTCRSDSKNTAYALTGTRYSSCPWKHCKHCPFVQWSLVIAFLHCCIHTVTFCVLRCIRSKVSLFKVFKNVKNFSATPPAGICCYFERHVGTRWVMTVWVTPAKRMRKKKTF